MAHDAPDRRRSIAELARREASEILAPTPSDRPWQLPFAISLAAGLPMFVGAWMGEPGGGALASIGAMTIVYLPRTSLDRRMVAIMAASCAMLACHALGRIGHMVPPLHLPLLFVVALLVTMACRFYRVGPPGPLFFVMAAAIGVYAPGTLAQLPGELGIFALGSLGAVGIAFFYSVHILRRWQPLPPPSPPEDILGDVVTDSVIIAGFVALSLVTAELLAFEKPYWVPVSCLAVIQGRHLRAVWNRQVQRIIGTFFGLGVAWLLLLYASTPWHAAIAVTLLLFAVEIIIVRHYVLAAALFTPLAIILAEATIMGRADPTPLMEARLLDTVLGSVFGMIGGLCLHWPEIRGRLRGWLARLAPPAERRPNE